MSIKKKKATKKNRKYLLELSSRSVLFWGSGLIVLLVWTFALGVLVGRGYLSFGLMQEKFSEIRKIMGKKDTPNLNPGKNSEEDPKFAFYEELSTKKEEAARKSRPVARKEPQKKKTSVVPKKAEVKPEVQKKDADLSRQYVLQIGSFGDKSKAVSLVDRLKKRDYPAYYSQASVGGKLFYRVKCGPFNTEVKADAVKKVLAQKENIHGFVTRAGT